jgi:hypothetical protein
MLHLYDSLKLESDRRIVDGLLGGVVSQVPKVERFEGAGSGEPNSVLARYGTDVLRQLFIWREQRPSGL